MPRSESSRPAGKRPLRALTPQEKIDAINRVHNGESKAAVARDIGVPESTLRGWCKAEDKIRTQLNNMRASGTYEHILTTSSSDNSDNSRPGSSSRSTPTAQTTIMGIGSTGSAEKVSDELEAGSASKRLKLDGSTSATATMSMNNMSNMSTSARASALSNETLFNPYLYTLLSQSVQSDPNKTIAFFNSFLKGDSLLPFSGYTSPTTNLVTDSLLHSRNNGAMTNMTIANMIKQQQQQTNNTLLNGNKRKYNSPGLTPTADVSRGSSRRQNSQSPNAEKSSVSLSIAQSVNNRTSPMPSTSASNGDVVAGMSTKSNKNCKRLNTIICNLQQQHGSSARVCNVGEEMLSNNAMNNNNNNVDHVDNETSNRRSPSSLPPGFSEMFAYCTKLVEWLQNYGSPICTFQQVIQIKSILDNMTNWANSKEIEPKKKTNGTS